MKRSLRPLEKSKKSSEAAFFSKECCPIWFNKALLAWYDEYGRHDLPWQHPRTPYTVWLSEIMLQQTQVATVIHYFNRFITTFPTVEALAASDLDEVLSLWAGLGYYARARHLHRAAQQVVQNHQAQFPETLEALISLPGIGPSTAAAIVTQAFNKPAAICDGNVKRVFTRLYGIDQPIGEARTLKQLRQIAEHHAIDYRPCDYTQALMDLGATCCTLKNPNCQACPVRSACVAFKADLTQQLPLRTKRPPKPVKETTFYLIATSTDVLLQRREETGIWGGLWSLPEAQAIEPPFPKAAIKSQLASKRHSFTHYHLDYRSVKVNLLKKSPKLGAFWPRCQWHPIDTLSQLGLPAPIKALLITD